MAKKTPANSPDVNIVLEFPSPELKQEAIEVFCREHGYVNQIAESKIPEETTKEEFFKERLGDIIIGRISVARIREEKAKIQREAAEARKNHTGSKIKEELKDVKIK
jgi:hypothetical protein